MLKKFAITGILIITVLCYVNIAQAEMPTGPYSYIQNFESTDSSSFWTSDGSYTVNFKGLTTEQYYSGTHSLKLDITLGTDATYVYYEIPLSLPAEGSLHFSGYMQLGADTSTGCTVGLGANVTCPPTTCSYNGSFAAYGSTGAWQRIDKDVVAWGKEKANTISSTCWEVTGADVGVKMDKIGIFLYGAPGQRIVVYIDALNLTGEVPSEADFQTEVTRRWAPADAKFDAKIAAWNERLQVAQDKIAALPAGDKKTELEQQLSTLQTSVSTITQRGYILSAETPDTDNQIESLIMSAVSNVYSYNQDFESSDPSSYWSGNGTYTVNYKGLTTEQAYAGTHSLKLDITFGTATYLYYKIPLSVPVEGSLQFSGRIQIGAGTTTGCTAGLGVNVYYPPTTRSACGPFGTYGPTPGVWQLAEGDMVSFGQSKTYVVSNYCWEVTGANVGVKMDKMGIFLYGASGKRIVVYIDALNLTGEVPSETDFQTEVTRRWAPADTKIDAKIAGWDTSLQQAQARINTFADSAGKTALQQQLNSTQSTVNTITQRGYILNTEVSSVDTQISQLLSSLPTSACSYSEDFESTDPSSFWTSDGSYTVNFKGLTTDQYYSGNQSLKLDVTLGADATYVYYEIPLIIPAEGSLHFTGHIQVGNGTGTVCTAGLGANVTCPPTTCSYNGSFAAYGLNPGVWRTIDKDVVAWGKEKANAISSTCWEVAGADVGVKMDKIGIFLYGAPGQRVVAYIDALNLTGEVPSEVDFQAEVNTRWAAADAKFDARITSLETRLQGESLQGKIDGFASGTLKSKFIQNLDNLSTTVDNIETRGYLYLTEHTGIEIGIAQLKAAIVLHEAAEEKAEEKLAYYHNEVTTIDNRLYNGYKYIRASEYNDIGPGISNLCAYYSNTEAILDGVMAGRSYFFYGNSSPITSFKVFSGDILIPWRISNSISLAVCPDEYEAAGFIVSSLFADADAAIDLDIHSLQVTPTDLERVGGGIIPAQDVDIKIVKCWYQSGTAWQDIHQDKSKRVLVPELLLKDDDLVKVSEWTEDNYLKLSNEQGTWYQWISNADEADGQGLKILPNTDFPVHDSATLLPVNIQARVDDNSDHNKQFWLTIKVPQDTQAGIYTGALHLTTSQGNAGDITLQVEVLPFQLASPTNYTSSIYYRGCLSAGGDGTVSSEKKSTVQLTKELEDMFAHGVTNPIVYQGYDQTLLGSVLNIREQVGMGNQPLYYLGVTVPNPPPAEGSAALDSFRNTVQSVVGFVQDYDIPEVYIYGRDEARGELLLSERPSFQAIHEAGAKVFVAGFDENFEAVGDLQDLHIYSAYPFATQAEQWHSVGHKIWSYCNPQGGVENPDIYRRNYGLLLWKNGFDGACTYAYQHSFGNIWNDFDHTVYRDEVFVYPTTDGVIDTIAWEGYREGVDDIRYVTTLLQAIESGKASGNSDKIALANEAESYINNLDVAGDLNMVRTQIISYIRRLLAD
ncbi:MAG: hypothetical protein PHT33_03080 [bacterium]|nr:hypothetical protein [bacterium]